MRNKKTFPSFFFCLVNLVSRWDLRNYHSRLRLPLDKTTGRSSFT